MKRLLFSLIVLVVSSVISAETTILKSNFSTENGIKNWNANNWDGYKPFPKFAYDADAKALHVEKATAGYGFGLVNHAEKLSAKAGDILNIRFQVRGSGRMFTAPQYFSEKGWTGIEKEVHVELTPEWSDKELEITVNDIETPTRQLILSFGGNQGTELWIRNFTAEVKTARYAGNISIPQTWQVFAPVPPDFQVKNLTEIPLEIAGIAPSMLKLDGTRLDLALLFPKKQAKNCAWLFAEVESSSETAWTLGAAADWWLKVYLNGKSVIDTMAFGNNGYPLSIDQQTAAVTLKKGRNIIAVQYLTGDESSVIELGGAPELRKIGQKLQLVETFFIDEFDKPGKRSGDPKLFRDILTDSGEICTWALYQSPRQNISLASSNVVLEPGKYLTAGLRLRSFGQTREENGSTSILQIPG